MSGRAEPIFLTYQDPFERFRIGDGSGSCISDPAKQKVLPGSQFPVEAYANYMKQTVPRWLSTDAAIFDAYLAEIDKVCPCVMILHSQGGNFGFPLAAEQRPDKIKAIVAVEFGHRRQDRQCAEAEKHPGADAVRRLRRPASALGRLQEDRHRVWRCHQSGRRHG